MTHEACNQPCRCWQSGYRAAERDIAGASHEYCTEHNRRCLCFDRGQHEYVRNRRQRRFSDHIPIPHDLEAEQSILGAMMDAPDVAIPLVENVLRQEDFYERTPYRLLFDLIMRGWEKGLMEEHGPEELRELLAVALAEKNHPEFMEITGPGTWVMRPWSYLVESCWFPYTTEEDDHGPLTLNDWFSIVTPYTIYYRDRVRLAAFRREVLAQLADMFQPLVVDDDPRPALAAILVRIRQAERRGRHRPLPEANKRRLKRLRPALEPYAQAFSRNAQLALERER